MRECQRPRGERGGPGRTSCWHPPPAAAAHTQRLATRQLDGSAPARGQRRSRSRAEPGDPPAPLVGHLAAWNYFQSVESDENDAFIEAWHAFTGDEDRVTNDPMEAHYIGFNMWVKAVEKAGTTEVDTVIDEIVGVSVPNPQAAIRR